MNKKNVKKLLENIDVDKDVPLKDKTTMRVGGRAEYYYKATTLEELVEVVELAREAEINHLVLGKGSNIIFSDNGYPGLVIDNKTNKVETQDTKVFAESGISLESLIRVLAEKGLGGLEFLSGIPGSLGGAIVNNAGSFGWQMADIIAGVLVLDSKGEKKFLKTEEMDFGYRKSALKGKTEGKNFPVVLKGVINAKRSSSDVVLRKTNDYKKIKAKKQPKGFSSGSIFCNPKVKGDIPDQWEELTKKGRIPAGFLLDQAGAKDLREGRAVVSDEHANFIINRSRARAQQVKDLKDKMLKQVQEKYGISLVPEVEFIGRFE